MRHFVEIFRRHFDKTCLRDICKGLFDETIWWDILWDIFMILFVKIFWWYMFILNLNETFWWHILKKHFDGPFLPWPWRYSGHGQVATLLEGHWLSDHFNEQTKTNMSQPGRRPGTAIGDERYVLQALLSRKDI